MSNIKSIKIKISNIYYFYILFFLLIITAAYHYSILLPIFNDYSMSKTFSTIANIHDHLVYYKRFNELEYYNFSIYSYFDNTTGISLLYYYACSPFKECNFHIIPLYLNILVICLMSIISLRITTKYFLSENLKFLFFLNFSIIYFAQLAGKDLFYSLFLYLILSAFLEKKWVQVFCYVIVCALLIRFQIIILFALLLIMNVKFMSFKLKVLVSYTFISALGYLALNTVLGVNAELGTGISNYVRTVNNNIYIGNFLLNPLRVLQYVIELITVPFTSLYPDIRFSELFVSGFTAYILLNFKKLPRLFDLSNNPFSVYFVCLLFTLLVTPIVNLRYFILIIPFLILAINYPKKYF